MCCATYANQTGEFLPRIARINFENVYVKKGGQFGILAQGYAVSPIRNVNIKNVSIEKVEVPYAFDYVVDIDLIDSHMKDLLIENPK